MTCICRCQHILYMHGVYIQHVYIQALPLFGISRCHCVTENYARAQQLCQMHIMPHTENASCDAATRSALPIHSWFLDFLRHLQHRLGAANVGKAPLSRVYLGFCSLQYAAVEARICTMSPPTLLSACNIQTACCC